MSFLKLVFSLGIPLMASAIPPPKCVQHGEDKWTCVEPNVER